MQISHKPAQPVASRAALLIAAAIPRHVAQFAKALLLAATLSSGAEAATSASRHGVTWYFSQDRPVGQFANGDPWVVGPVVITSITPAMATVNGTQVKNGTVVNPPWASNAPGFDPNVGLAARQGWDSRMRDTMYLPALNIAGSLPATIGSGSSVCSAISFDEWLIGNAQQLDTIAILTVVASAPADGSFRPPYIGGVDKSVKYNKSNLDYSKLKTLPVVPYAPSFASVEPNYEKTHIALTPGWTADYVNPLSHDNPGYGREISHKSSQAALLLNLAYSNAQKERLLILFVQRGIDIAGILASGGYWWADGGHNHGRKMPMMMAGWVLNSPEILALANSRNFQEDQQHFYVTQADVDLPRLVDGRKRDPYTVAMIGMADWGSSHVGYPAGSGSNWDIYYRDFVGNSTIGNVLAARIMGMQNAWNNPATFDYYDRHWDHFKSDVSNGSNSIQPFVAEMWKAYRNGGGSITPPIVPGPGATPTFAVGERIQIVADAQAYSSASAASSVAGLHKVPDLGAIVEGPSGPDSSNTVWYRVDFDTGADGWISQVAASKSLSPPASTLAVGDSVKTWRLTWVNSTAAVTTSLGSNPADTSGVIIEGPFSNGTDNIVWFRIDYASGPDGWSGADNLVEVVSGAPVLPSTPTGLKALITPKAP